MCSIQTTFSIICLNSWISRRISTILTFRDCSLKGTNWWCFPWHLLSVACSWVFTWMILIVYEKFCLVRILKITHIFKTLWKFLISLELEMILRFITIISGLHWTRLKVKNLNRLWKCYAEVFHRDNSETKLQTFNQWNNLKNLKITLSIFSKQNKVKLWSQVKP